ncbi:MAG: 1-acyl-sn-glycerol-3-phosphate acyltransferase [Deltaproteobacteria bacterium]|nr:1-acyl-sn-glycerol-3-phosphate acyltransferase [Deltaproteobacteria bacterium]
MELVPTELVRRRMESLRFATRAAAFAATTAGMLGVLEAEARLRGPADADAVTSKWAGRWGRALLRIFGIRLQAGGPHIEKGRRYPGTGPDGIGRLFVMNHRSGMDIPVTLASVDARVVSRADLAGWPLIGPAARRAGALFVDRDSKQSSTKVLWEISRSLRHGQAVALYPEGTSFPDDEVRPFRAGAFVAARRSGAPVVPLGIAYADPRTAYWHESFLGHVRRVAAMRTIEVALEAGEPIPSRGRRVEELCEEVQAAVQALVRRARARLLA